MKSTIKKSTYKAIYRLLNRVSPLPSDCGALCSSACCCGNETEKEDDLDFEMGIYLLPGEEKLFTRRERHILSVTAVSLLVTLNPLQYKAKRGYQEPPKRPLIVAQ